MATPIRVLLVDDERTFVLNMARLLKFRGFDVFTAFNGFEALAALESEAYFDAVVLDIKMPGMNGLDVLSKIKKAAPKTEVIMLTGHATVESGIQSLREGAFDYLMKPCDIEDLAEKIKEACEVERIRSRPVLWPRHLVKEIIWPSFIRLTSGDMAAKALEVFRREADMPVRESLYIMDENDRFVGTVTRRDLLAAAQGSHPERLLTWEGLLADPGLLPAVCLGDLMHPDHPFAVNPEENLNQVARRMIDNNVRCMPVVEGDRVRGIIRLQDIFKYVETEAL